MKTIRLKIRGNCVDDLFHILAINGYNVQLSTTPEINEFIVDIILKDSEVIEND